MISKRRANKGWGLLLQKGQYSKTDDGRYGPEMISKGRNLSPIGGGGGVGGYDGRLCTLQAQWTNRTVRLVISSEKQH